MGTSMEEPMIAPPMDSLRIDVIPLAEGPPPGSEVNNVLRAFLSNLRVASGQWWITRSIDPLLGWQWNSFRCDKYGKPMAPPDADVAARTPSGHERPISEITWNQALAATECGDDPEFHEVLMLDAHFFAVTSEYRQLVLDASTACENLKERVIKKLWSASHDGVYRRGKVLKGYDLPAHLDKDLQKICGRSFKDEKSDAFRSIEWLWDARGNVAHGEGAFYRDQGVRVNVSDDNAKQLLNAARTCINWLYQLDESADHSPGPSV